MRYLLILFFSLSSLSASEISVRLLTPDGLTASQGKSSTFKVIMANHSSEDRLLACHLHAPQSWDSPSSPAQLLYLPPNTAKIIPLSLKIPPHTSKGTYRIAIGIAETESEALVACDQLLLVVD